MVIFVVGRVVLEGELGVLEGVLGVLEGGCGLRYVGNRDIPDINLNFSDDLLLSVVLLGDLNVVAVGYWLSFHRVDGRTTIVVDSNL